MGLLDEDEKQLTTGSSRSGQPNKLARARLAKELFSGRYRPGKLVLLPEIAAEYQMNVDSVLKVFADFQTLGMVTLSGKLTATIHSPNPKEMHEAYEIRAALEELGARAAAPGLKGNIGELQRELNAMRAAVRDLDFDSFTEHDVRFHRIILQASQNEVLLRVWNTLAVDLRIRGSVEKVAGNLPEIVESHQPIIHALGRGQGKEAGLLLRNHVETVLELLKKSDSGLHRALRKDLELAKDVQQAFFPQQSLSIPGLTCETFYQPAQSIGGDYYDFFPLQGGRWGIAIGDVSGKGIGAALLMASLQASLKAQALHPHSDVPMMVSEVNRLVHESSPGNFFASLFYGEYQPATRVLRYVNAGHNPPMVLRWKDGRCEVIPLETEGTPVGALEHAEYTSATVRLEIGDVLIAYTDGITEAENPQSEFWGQQRLEKLLRSCHDRTPKEIIRSVLDEVAEFSKGHPQRDDITLVVVRAKDEVKL
jgi:serine phosphatase RsbU (regulator of sigma subunit)/DNA-binding GntR family transcriptional regulator